VLRRPASVPILDPSYHSKLESAEPSAEPLAQTNSKFSVFIYNDSYLHLINHLDEALSIRINLCGIFSFSIALRLNKTGFLTYSSGPKSGITLPQRVREAS
jgi:hypothetical protein